MGSTPLNIYRGSLESINNRPQIVDGSLYFAVDTKQIYLDYDVDNGIYEGPERIKFGGSTGIWYGKKDEEDLTIAQVIFTKSELEEAADYPAEKDLILNKNGSFFKVVSVNAANDQIIANRLTVSGVGGGGSSGSSFLIDGRRVGLKNIYVPISSKNINLTFIAETSAGPDMTLYANIVLKDSTGLAQDIGRARLPYQSMNVDNPIILDIKSYLDKVSGIRQDQKYTIELHIEDDDGRKMLYPIVYELVLVNISLDQSSITGNLGTKKSSFTYDPTPRYSSALENVTLYFKVINIATNRIVQDNVSSGGKKITGGNSGVAQQLTINGDIPVGSYKIETWLTAVVPNTGGQDIVTSNTIIETFTRQASSGGDPILSVNYPKITDFSGILYSTIDIAYFISYTAGAKIEVYEIIDFIPEGSNVSTQIVKNRVNREAEDPNIKWNYRFMEKGKYRFTIQIGDSTANAIKSDYYIVNIDNTDTGTEIPQIATGALVINFTANKENDDADRELWISSTDRGDLTCDLSDNGFNWISNGWVKEQIGNDIEKSLLLNNGAKAIIDFSPFVVNNDEPDNTILKRGLTIEFDVKISNIKKRQAEIIKCVSRSKNNAAGGKSVLNAGIIINGDYFTINGNQQAVQPIDDYEARGYIDLTKAGMTAPYAAGKRIRVTFVITPVDKVVYPGMAKAMIYTYIDGVLSGFVPYKEANFLHIEQNKTEESGKLIFDSEFADINIYNIRSYETALSDKIILQNYCSSLVNFNDGVDLWYENNILNDDTNEIDLEKFMNILNSSNVRKIPYLLMRGGSSVTDKKGTTYRNNNIVGLPTAKDDYKLVDVCYIDPEHPENNIGSLASNDRVEWVIYVQGTSSKDYPIKNLRSKYARDNKDDTYQLFPDLPPVDLFCFKADYMESSSAHNTGLGNMLNDLYGDIKTPSRLITDENYNYVTAIKGKPCIIFYKETDEELRDIRARNERENLTDYKYIGRYNFNLDKSTHEPFGFYSDKDRHYGVAVIDPPLLNDQYEQNLSKTTLLSGYQATTDELPEEGKIYYKDPYGKEQHSNNIADLIKYDSESKEDVWKFDEPVYEYKDVNKNEYLNSIQVWECLDNNLPLTHFRSNWDEEIDKNSTKIVKDESGREQVVSAPYNTWITNFESRYPEYPKEEMSDKRELARLINWIYSTRLVYEVIEDFIDDEGQPATRTVLKYYSKEPTYDMIQNGTVPKDLVPLFPSAEDPKKPTIQSTSSSTGKVTYKSQYECIYDSYDYRLNKFIEEFNIYFEVDLTLFYYLITELLLMTDSRAKNMMLCTFTAGCKDKKGNSVTKWFPIFYDMDTGLAVNNSGQLKFRYSDEDYFEDVYNAEAGYVCQNSVIKEDGTLEPIFNQSHSTLWANIRLGFQNELKGIWNRLRNGTLKYNYLLDGYNKNQANYWSEILINKDEFLKYIEPTINDTNWKVMKEACQGTRSQHREQFLKQRLFYLDTKYGYIPEKMGLTLRIGSLQKSDKNGAFSSLNVTTNNATYLMSQFGNSNANFTRSDRLPEKSYIENVTISAADASGMGEQPYIFYGINQIENFGNLSVVGVQSINQREQASTDNALKTLIIGRQYDPNKNSPPFEYELKRDYLLSDLSVLKYFPMLETLDISHQIGLTELDLSNNKNLKELYAHGTCLGSCIFPEGGVLKTLYLPSTLKQLTLTGHQNLDTINYQSYSSDYLNNSSTISNVIIKENAWEELQGLYVQQCPKVDTQMIFSKMAEGLTPSVELPDINWTVELEDMKYELGADGISRISEINILEKLLTAIGKTHTDISGNKGLNRTYVKGNILLKNGSYGIDESILYNKYQKYYPYITFTYENWDEDTCIKAYSFNVYDTNNRINIETSKKYTSVNAQNDFTFDKIFQDNNGTILLKAEEKVPTQEYNFEFMGWNTEKPLIITEQRTGVSIEEAIQKAREECKQKVIIAWDENTQKYSIANNFNFMTAFDNAEQTLNIYPTFLGMIRTWTATFTDGQGTIIDTQNVRYGDTAVPPNLIPSKFELDPADLTVTWCYPFICYGSLDETYIITGDKTYEAMYSTTKQLIQKYPADSSWFTVDNLGNITLNKNYNAEAICIPKKIINNQGVQVDVLGVSFNSNQNIKRIYFEPDNVIVNLNQSACKSMPQLEYFDLYALPTLVRIGKECFYGNKLMITSEFNSSAPVASIEESAFNNCGQLDITYLPTTLNELGVAAFSTCTNLQVVDLMGCTSLKTIPERCFVYCNNLKLLNEDLPSNITMIGKGAFSYDPSLVVNFAFNTGLTMVDTEGFNRTNSLTLANLPSKIEIIGNKAFAGSTAGVVRDQKLLFQKFPSTLKSIGSEAFTLRYLQDGVLDLSACKNIEYIDSKAFSGLENIINIILPTNFPLEVPENYWGALSSVNPNIDVIYR